MPRAKLIFLYIKKGYSCDDSIFKLEKYKIGVTNSNVFNNLGYFNNIIKNNQQQ